MRLDHLLSKEKKTSSVWINPTKTEEEVEGSKKYCSVMRVHEAYVHLGNRVPSVAAKPLIHLKILKLM